jgi:hypothetical protein
MSRTSEVELLRESITSLRETNKRLNRRCQSAEAGLAAKLESGPCFGRALANASATMHRAQNAELRELLERFYCAYTEMWGGDNLGVLLEDVEALIGDRWKCWSDDAADAPSTEPTAAPVDPAQLEIPDASDTSLPSEESR